MRLPNLSRPLIRNLLGTFNQSRMTVRPAQTAAFRVQHRRRVDGDDGYQECTPASSPYCVEFVENCDTDGCGPGSVEGGGVSCACPEARLRLGFTAR